MSVQLEVHARGVVLPVKAQPGARRTGIRGVQAGALKVSVTQIAEKGKANVALVQVLAEALQLRSAQLTLLSGQASGQKRFLVEGVSVEELSQRIKAALAEARA
jgi:uncharacterized protein